ncbi:MAG TPA: hypothetical protein VMA37_03735 [Acetobacteraceae bacterium]|nr:hypothetical protein [Acetobacteraceae bacterium]
MGDNDFDVGLWLDEWLKGHPEVLERSNRLKNPYLLHMIKVLWPYDTRGLRRVDIIDRVRSMRPPSSKLPMPRAFEETVQSAYNHYCSESEVFKKRGAGPDEALFYPVGRKGSGKWAVRRDRAREWLLKHEFEL